MAIAYNSSGQGVRVSAAFKLAGLLFLALCAFLLALAINVVPWSVLVAACSIPLFLVGSWLFPEVVVVALIASLFGVLPEFLLPSISIGGGTFKPEDLGIPALFCMLMVKNFSKIGSRLALIKPYLMPLGLFILIAAISAIVAVLFKTAPAKDILNEARPYSTWLLLAVLALAIHDERSVRRFLWSIFGLALVLASGTMFQSLTGFQIFSRGQELRQLWSTGGTVEGVLRSTTPGMFVMNGALIFLLALFAKGEARRPLLMSLCVALLIGGSLVGFGRGMWLSVAVGVLLLFFYSKTAYYARLLLAGFFALLVCISGMYVAKPDYVDAFAERLFSVVDEVEYGSSFGRRKEENRYALDEIIQSPIRGVGLGGNYKPENAESIAWPEQARYIHNAYMKVAVKTGIPGLLAALYVVATILVRARRCAIHSKENPALAFAAYWVLLTTLIFTAPTQPNFVASNGVASICIAIYLIELLMVREGQSAKGAEGAGHLLADDPTVKVLR